MPDFVLFFGSPREIFLNFSNLKIIFKLYKLKYYFT